ncbi:putative aimless RasGEF (aleA) [Purpureocillium lavendulum]|uniref:Aimless RasGEF (AleA) n=1 Tax=Purpureocillium lavendulum TaxID=1247861 RepID=A0AB34FLA8_9HYPO|nr:putative aimless RasGEF (aleA) [Purpureocillium lavendulum]
MTSSNARSRDAHRTSDGPRPHRRPSGATTTTTPTPRPSASAARDSAQSNATASVFSRTSTSTDLTANTSTASSAGSLLPSDTGGGDRDSFVSIVDDPFFRRFGPAIDENDDNDNDDDDDDETPHREPSSEDESSATDRDDSDDNDKTKRWPPPRRESLTIGPSQYYWGSAGELRLQGWGAWRRLFIETRKGLTLVFCFLQSNSGSAMESYNVAVIGASSVGKSTFIQRVFALPRPPITNASTVRQIVDSVPFMVTLLELDLDHFELNSRDAIQWPKQINGHIIPKVDSALMLYDVTDEDSVHPLPPVVEDNGETTSRRRAQSAANLEAPDHPGRPISQHSKHSRASSDFSVLRGFSNAQGAESHRAQSSRSPRPGFRFDRPGGDSFLELEESEGESRRNSDDIPILQRSDDAIVERQPKVAGVTFDELVDRLLAMRLSRVDNNFSDIFLCLYRKFAAPGELFSAILIRLDRVRDDKTAHYLTKTATQLRIIEVVAKWVSLYPGDFARPKTRRNLEDFIKHLSTEPVFSLASQQMRRNLQHNVIVDDDTGWANADDAGDEIASKILSKEMSELSTTIDGLQIDDEVDGRPSNSSEASAPDKTGMTGSPFQFNSYDEYEKEASLLEPTDHLPMNKFRYHIFMDMSDDDIADELTRIDWIMFSSIRIRDFVRHVSLSSAQKEKCKSLRNVNRMINHFNHIAKWVANMILLRDKAKHRAQMLEKFMNIAVKLRQLNNYNGLAAVLAGINGTAIHRLAQTRALVPPDVHKRFATLTILMGTQKSHFAYRLAWENSPLPRIPFIPLHRRDLVSAEEGSKTFVGPSGDRINWKKFEVLGEVLLPIMKSRGTAYPNLTKLDNARDLILGCRMPTDDEEIYQRSLQVESSSSGPVEPSKKKFPWFAK